MKLVKETTLSVVLNQLRAVQAEHDTPTSNHPSVRLELYDTGAWHVVVSTGDEKGLHMELTPYNGMLEE